MSMAQYLSIWIAIGINFVVVGVLFHDMRQMLRSLRDMASILQVILKTLYEKGLLDNVEIQNDEGKKKE